MYSLIKYSENWLDRVRLQQKFSIQQFQSIEPEVVVIAQDQLQDQPIETWALIRVIKGVMGLMIDESRLLAIEPGDVWLGYPGERIEWYQEGALELEVWPWQGVTLPTALMVLQGYNDLVVDIVNCNPIASPDPMPGFDFFNDGDVIIQEGEVADSVFTLIQGRAKVMIDGRQVGEAKENEIIGLQAMLLKTTRTASVIADGPCSVVRVQYDKFRTLIAARPELVISTMETMAIQINRANQRITQPE